MIRANRLSNQIDFSFSDSCSTIIFILLILILSLQMIDDATKYREKIEDIEDQISDGTYRGPPPIWKDPKNWSGWCMFIGAEYAIGFLGFVLVVACLWHVEITGALIVVIATSVGLCMYRNKQKNKRKNWEKARDPRGYAEKRKTKGLRGIKNKVTGGGGKGASSDLVGGGKSPWSAPIQSVATAARK